MASLISGGGTLYTAGMAVSVCVTLQRSTREVSAYACWGTTHIFGLYQHSCQLLICQLYSVGTERWLWEKEDTLWWGNYQDLHLEIERESRRFPLDVPLLLIFLRTRERNPRIMTTTGDEVHWDNPNHHHDGSTWGTFAVLGCHSIFAKPWDLDEEGQFLLWLDLTWNGKVTSH